MKVVITGANGFIGRNVLRRAKNFQGVEFHALSHSINDSEVELWPHVRFTKISTDHSHLREIFHEIKPDALIHLGWKGIPDYSIANSIDSFTWSIEVTRLSISAGVKKIISTGSCWEYLSPNKAIDENWPIDRSNAFKLAKSNTREFMSLMCREANVKFIWARLFYVYGKYQNPHSLIPSLFKQLRNDMAPFANNPFPALDFINAEYVADILLNLLFRDQEEEIINVGSGKPTRILDIVNTLRVIHGYPVMDPKQDSEELIFYSGNLILNKITDLSPPNILDDLQRFKDGFYDEY